MLKLDLILQIMNQRKHFLKKEMKKVIGLMKDELGGQIMKEFVDLKTGETTMMKIQSKIHKKVCHKKET